MKITTNVNRFSNRISGCLLAAVTILGLTVTSANQSYAQPPTVGFSQSANQGDVRNDEHDDGNPGVFPPDSRPFGLSYAEWSAKWWQWALGIKFTDNPILDPNGHDCAVHQSGPVWFLAGGGPPPPLVRTCDHIPADKAILFPIVNFENDYPCPDPNFKPAPGQSLQDFLTNGNPNANPPIPGARQVEDAINQLEADVDWVKLRDLFDYRATSPLFYFTGDPSLTSTFDSCITGSRQPAVSDGYWIMLKPLSPGQHKIHFSAAVGTAVAQDVTYYLKVVGSHEGDH